MQEQDRTGFVRLYAGEKNLRSNDYLILAINDIGAGKNLPQVLRDVLQQIETLTKDWKGYKVHLGLSGRIEDDEEQTVPLYGPRCVNKVDVRLRPNVATMILRASNYVPPSQSDRCNILQVQGGEQLLRVGPGFSKFKALPEGTDVGWVAILSIAKQQRVWDRSLAVEYSGTIKEVLGVCHVLGITIDGSPALSVQKCITAQERRKKNEKEQDKEEKEKERENVWVLPSNEEDVKVFINEEGQVDLTLCKDTTMTKEERKERRSLAVQKILETCPQIKRIIN